MTAYDDTQPDVEVELYGGPLDGMVVQLATWFVAVRPDAEWPPLRVTFPVSRPPPLDMAREQMMEYWWNPPPHRKVTYLRTGFREYTFEGSR